MPRLVPTLLLPVLLAGSPLAAQNGTAALQGDVQHQLDKKQFKDVHAEVSGDSVTLTGTVPLLADKLDAEKRVGKLKDLSGIHNEIQVNGGEISDQQIFNKLAKQLAYDREGYPSFPFNSITLQVHNGVALLGGEVVDPVDKESAVGLVTNMRGVTGLIDHLQVAPVSPLDWQIRRAEYQAIYGAPIATKYAIDPGKPIRIVVENGHVILTGVVNSTGDRDILYQRANAVPNVFSVKNDLQVAGSGSESGQ